MNNFASVLRIINMYKEYDVVTKKKKKVRQFCNLPPLSTTYDFFDGVVKDGICGVGYVLKINEDDHIKLRLNYNLHSNTKAELMALWCLLLFASSLGIDSIQIFGYLLVIIKWEKKLCSLQIISLHHWCKQTEEILTSFHEISIECIFKALKSDLQTLFTPTIF